MQPQGHLNTKIRAREAGDSIRESLRCRPFHGLAPLGFNDPGVTLAKPRFTPGYTLTPASQAELTGYTLTPASLAKFNWKSERRFEWRLL